MKPCKHCGETKPLSAFYKHKAMKDGHLNVCKPCRDAYVKSWDRKNSERRREIARDWNRENATPEKRAASWAKWYHGTAKENGAYARMVARKTERERVLIPQATPAWSNEFFIEQAYDIARKRSEVTGIRWEVDHIVPLKSDLVCGLHTHDNLQVITKFANQSKKNYRWPQMPGSD